MMPEGNEQASLVIEKFFKVESLLHRYRHFMRKDQGRMGADPFRGQGRVLALLKLQPEISQRELGFLLDMRTQSLGELLAKLERSGYIVRTPNETDRRVLNIRLTPEGEAVAARMAEVQRNMENPFDFLTEEEQASFINILDKVIAALEEKMGEGGAEDERWEGRFPWFDPRDPRLEQLGDHIRRSIRSGKFPWEDGFFSEGGTRPGNPCCASNEPHPECGAPESEAEQNRPGNA